MVKNPSTTFLRVTRSCIVKSSWASRMPNKSYQYSPHRRQWALVIWSPNNSQFKLARVPSLLKPSTCASEQEQQNPWLYAILSPDAVTAQPHVGLGSKLPAWHPPPKILTPLNTMASFGLPFTLWVRISSSLPQYPKQGHVPEYNTRGRVPRSVFSRTEFWTGTLTAASHRSRLS